MTETEDNLRVEIRELEEGLKEAKETIKELEQKIENARYELK